ncbi:MAG: ribonuclease Z [Thermoproteota archaeon]|nr:ribonuclease Z [Thermoproteota archaeon]
MANLEVTFLGTSAAMPSENRFLSSIVIERNGSLFIFDVGEGMQYNFIRAKRFGFNKKTMIFITHMHSDHILGLLGFFQTLSLQGRTLPIDIYGPELLHDFLVQNLNILHINLSFELNIHTVNSNKGILVLDKEYQVLYCRSDHGPNLHSFSFCLQENKRPGRFNLEKAKDLGIPEGNLYNRLQKGNDIYFNGRLIRSDDVVGPSRPGRKIGISGDTRPTAELADFFRSCDLLIFESTFKVSESSKAKESYHSTASESALLAKSAGVDRLCLTHFSTRYKDLGILLNEAKLEFEKVELAFDLKRIAVPYRDS